MVTLFVTVNKEKEHIDSKTNLIIENTLLKIKEKTILRKQEIPGTEIMQQKLNQNIFLFLLFPILFLHIHLIVG